MKKEIEQSSVAVYYLSPIEARPCLLGGGLNLAKIVLNLQTETIDIIIDSTLPDDIQKVLLVYEEARLSVFQEWARSSYSVGDVFGEAHKAGFKASTEKAVKLGVLRKYLDLRRGN